MSVFTFDPDPPRVSSPWLQPSEPRQKRASEQSSEKTSLETGLLSDYGVTKLEAEPQHGPTEYKLHLLLRPRRTYLSMSTTMHVSGSTQSRPILDGKPVKSVAASSVTSSSPSAQTRQARLEHLTTQLLWRLQQSCPYHAASTTAKLVVPTIPDEDVATGSSIKIGKLLPGLEASRGALYELGVADDGTLVGLTKDELDESLATLRVMAASLGCMVEVLRLVIVGDCEWSDVSDGSTKSSDDDRSRSAVVHKAKLWVAEAIVTPDLVSRDAGSRIGSSMTCPPPAPVENLPDPKKGAITTEQLRVTFTGPTTSGKSTLLGTLLTGTLDNGHGKSRLFKHRHEVESGVTSSVAAELIGYNETQILNYSHPGIESWIDIHDFTQDGRLVVLLDSAGHPRYRRTILRGIIGWAPHWTLLCIAADDTNVAAVAGAGTGPSAEDIQNVAGSAVDLSKSHLDLCLSLGLPLVVLITKLDLANRASLQRTLAKVLSALKTAGRSPKILHPDQSGNDDLTRVSKRDEEAVSGVVKAISSAESLQSTVPIILTSAVKGSGIGLVHALLRSLPLPPVPTSHDYIGPALNPEQPECLFHIEDRFDLPASYGPLTPKADDQPDLGTVVAGYVRFGSLSVGNEVLIGPFPADEDNRGLTPEDRGWQDHFGLSISHISSAELSRMAARHDLSASTIKGEWHTAKVVSIRNLRLPVQTLEAGQVGSVGIVFQLPGQESLDRRSESAFPPVPKLRKGMVLAIPSRHMIETGLSLQAASGLTAAFRNPDAATLTVGSLVNIYSASVRAAARVLRVSRTVDCERSHATVSEDIEDVFDLNSSTDYVRDKAVDETEVEVQLELLTNREWIELGSRILLLEGGNRDKSGLEGYVGKVMEIVD
ncbi:hypothetical protein VTK73DRAFT_9484 [Phialemonium thermophilum]|uniref:Tr-type G domain-containing protein n=1 Tax=Phialemonium thermophilum TaxID=223376 RepID=A0ABR3Y5H2_9PEZI